MLLRDAATGYPPRHLPGLGPFFDFWSKPQFPLAFARLIEVALSSHPFGRDAPFYRGSHSFEWFTLKHIFFASGRSITPLKRLSMALPKKISNSDDIDFIAPGRDT